MNIKDKARFYSEIKRVLTDDGVLIYYDIFKKGDGNINFPVPWANNSTVSFLANTYTIDTHLADLDFTKLITIDQTYKAKEFLDRLFEKIKKNGPPKLGLNVLMGDATKVKLTNILSGLKEDKLELQSGV
jgi:ubiquinone/menaquinone biosynthesis C-methylase UbiE